MAELLFELGIEEIPAYSIEPAANHLGLSVTQGLGRHRVYAKELKTFGTPRRIGVLLLGLPERAPDTLQHVYGPPKHVALENGNQLSAKGLAFIQAQGEHTLRWFIKETKRGEVLCAEKLIPGASIRDLAQKLFLEALDTVAFQKVMRWGYQTEPFIRPVRWILAILDGETLSIERYGLKSGNVTFPHRYKGFDPICVGSPKDFPALMEKDGLVLVFPEERKRRVLEQVHGLLGPAESTGNLKDEALSEVANITEWPRAFVGAFDSRFMVLPGFVIEHVIYKHQKCLAVYEKASGNILPKFIAVSNLPLEDLAPVRLGFERVVRARLEDALFYFQQDLKKPLLERYEDLENIVEHERLGTLKDKVLRLKNLAYSIDAYPFKNVDPEKLDMAIRLMKCDLTTRMVGEFPELQGRMGEEYAKRFGYDDEVSRAIFEATLPLPTEPLMPSTPLGACLSIVDKLDTLCGFSLIGLLPTSAKDPYGLKRKAFSLMRVLVHIGVPLSIKNLVRASLATFQGQLGLQALPDPEALLLSWLKQRAESWFEAEGYDRDAVNAIMARSQWVILKDFRKLAALSQARQKGDFGTIGVNIKRIRNIIRENEAFTLSGNRGLPLNPSDFELQEEKDLFAAFQSLDEAAKESEKTLRYETVMTQIAALKDPLENFFSNVMVNVEDSQIRQRRVALLVYGFGIIESIMDFSQLSLEKPS